MKKLFLAVATTMVLGGAASADPGFVKAVFAGSAYNGTSDIWSYSKATVVSDLEEIYRVRSDIPTTTTYAYGTYMQLEGGVEYYFDTQFDDHSSVKIDNAIVVPTGSDCERRYGVVKFAKTAWHKVELRFSNNGGAGGNMGYSRGGVWMKKGASGTYEKIQNNEEGTRCVTEAPEGYEPMVPEYAYRYATYSSGGVTYIQLIRYGGCSENLAIPDMIDGYYVGQINDSCFNGNTAIKNIVQWPSKLMTIGGSAFYGCTGLVSAEIPDTVTSLGGSAFRCCSALKTAKLPKNYSRTADALFMDCTSLESVTMPDAPTQIDNHTFRNCVNLKNVVVPESVSSIGSYAFCECCNLPSLMLPENLSYIGEYAFYHCASLDAIDIPEAVSVIGGFAFAYCESIRSIVIPEGIETINVYLLRGCRQLKEVVLPESLTRIEQSVFEDCISLEEIHIPSRVEYIGPHVFRSCSRLTTVNIPNQVTALNAYLFYGCASLVRVDVPAGVTQIGESAFLNCTELVSIDIPDTVSSMGGSVFSGCSKLSSVHLPANITSIPGGCFSGCTSLTKIHLPDKIETIGNDAFNGCTALAEINFPDSLKGIYWYAFVNCVSLRSVEFPAGLEFLNNHYESYGWGSYPIFGGCSGLQNVIFHGCPPDGVGGTALMGHHCVFPKEYGSQWIQTFGINSFTGYSTGSILTANVISSKIRENDPTIMDVVYKVTSKKPKVKIRVLAFEDGTRSFAKVVRPTTFVDGTEVNIGDNVTPNVEHTISWRVSADWQTKLAKVKFEVLAMEGDLLPLELMTIPASDQYGKMKISWNAISANQWFDALLWLYADKDPNLALSNGSLRNRANNQELANGENVSGGYSYYDPWGNFVGYHWEINTIAPSFVFNKMGYQLLTGAPLTYANQETRLGLSPSGARQYAYKIVEE